MHIVTHSFILRLTPNQCFAGNKKLPLNEAQYRALIHRPEDEKGLLDKHAVTAEDITNLVEVVEA